MALADSVFESLQCFQSMMESFDESLSQLRKDNSIESVLNLWKNLLEYYRELHKTLQSNYEAPNIEEEKSEEPGTRSENEENKTSEVTGSSPTSSSVSKVFSSVEVRPELKILCDKGDGHGLRNYIADNIKEVETLRNELRAALSKSPDAAKLVMKSLEDYPLKGEYRDFRITKGRRACILLLESLSPVFGNDDSGVVPSDVKDSAREIAKVWRKEMKLIRKEALNIQAFLQLLASFRIAADYKKDELLALLSVILSFDGTPELCRSLGLSYEALKINEEKPEEPGTRGENEENKTSEVTGSSPNSSSVREVLSSVEVHHEIKILCDKADGHGLINLIVDNIKEFQAFRNELPVALSKAPDAGKLVVKALEGYPVSASDSTSRSENRKRPYILLLESLFPVFGNDDRGVVPSDVKNSAREIAKVWRKNIKVSKKEGWNIHAFLQLLATFRIAADYRKDELLQLMSVILSRTETPELCRSLGLSSEVPNLMNKLPKRARQIKVLRFAYVCGIMDKVDPVGLLTSYLRDEDKDAEKLLTNGHGSADSQLQSNTKKLTALQIVIKHVQEYGLQNQFFGDNWEKKLRELEQERDELKKTIRKISEEKSAAEEGAREKEDGKKAAEKKAQEKEDGKKAAEDEAQEKEEAKKATEEKAHEKEDGKKAAEKKAHEKEDGQKGAEKKAPEKSTKEKLADQKEAQSKDDEKKAAEKEAQEKEDGKKAPEKNIQHTRRQSFEPGYGPSERENYASNRPKYASLIKTTSVAGDMGNSKASPYNIDGVENKSGIIGHNHHTSTFSAANRSSNGFAVGAFSSAPSTAAQEKRDGKKAAEQNGQHKRRQSFEPACGPSERENYASKRANYASLNMTTRVAGGMGNSKASPYNIDVVRDKSGIIGHDHHTSAFSAANRSSTGFAAGAFSSAPSTAAQINDERRHNPLPFGTSNLTPIGSSLYGSSVPAGAFAVPMSNVGEVNYEGRSQQSQPMTFGEDKNHVRASGDLAKSSATQSNYNYEGRGQQSYKLNFGEVDNNPARTSTYGIGILENSSTTQSHCERRGRELYTSAFGGGNMSSIGSSVYGSNSRTIPSSYVNQGGHDRSLGQYSGFAGRNMVSIESSGYGPGVSPVPPSNVTQGHSESRGPVTDRYHFNSGLTSLHPAYRAS